MKKRQRLLRIFFAAILYLAAAKTGLAYNAELLKAGDRFYQEKFYQMALDQYRALLQGSASLPPEVIRELNFKSADCLWRGQTENTPIDEAERILKDLQSSKDHDRWWAEANESLADYYLKVNRWAHTEEIKQFLMLARDYWAGAGDVESARPRFIKASFTLGDYLSQNRGWYYTGITPTRFSETRPGLVPEPAASGLDILYIEILKVAQSDGDKARAHYGLAMSYLYRAADQKTQELVEDHFNEVIGNYKTSEWVDDAYYYLGQFFEGRSEFKKALMYYQGLLGRFKAGESQWIDQVGERVKQITEPAVSVNVGYTFLPGSEIQLALSWRNVSEARVTLYKMDMVREMQARAGRPPTDNEWGISDYSTLIREVVESGRYNFLHSERSWVQKFKEEGKHLHYSENKGLAEWLKDENEEKIDAEKGRLSPGAYLVLVTASGKKAYDLILVTDLGLVVKTAGQSALFFAFDSKTGEPRRAARVKFHYRYYNDQNNWVWEEAAGVTDDSGLLSARLKTALNSQNYQSNQHNLFAAASDGTMQTFTQGSYYNYRAQATPWRLYAFSDRPAYRPNEEVAFKGILRQYDGAAFRTPAGATVHARIYDVRGNKIKEGSYVLNPYGSFDDRLVLDEKAALGEYRLEIWSENWQNQLATATLFRLEEYKLPEFLVSIKAKPQDKDGKTVTAYRLGDTVEVELNAEYYFGGAVADADVEYRIYQSPYYPAYSPARPYPWYYADLQQQPYSYANYDETLLKQDKVKTDKEGHAVFKFETPGTSPTDLNYRIEARVVDQSRREIVSGSEIKVTRYSFFACLTPKQNLYRPGDKAEIDIKTLTANQEPVSVEAKISVLKNGWQPGPMEPLGQTESRIPGDRVAVAGHYSGTEVLSKFVKTDAKGEAKFEFEPSEDGYYVIQFTGYDNTSGEKIESQASVYVGTKQSRDIGYRYGGLQIIPEKDTYTIGETARVMLVAERPDTWVLLTREAEEIYDHQMVHLEGPVKLLEFPVRDIDTPNVFLHALSGDRYELKMHALELIVPPEEKFLNIKITSDQETYQPQQEGHFEITVTDQDGKPVVGEVALGIVDKSVYYIQGEYVPDIRQYFYGQKRIHSVTTQASFHSRSFVRLERDDKDQGLSGGKPGERERREMAVGSSLGAVMDAAEVAAPAAMALKSESALEKDAGARQASARMLGDFREDKKMDSLKEKTASAEEPNLAAADVRTDFRSTVVWQPAVVTDLGGKASLNVKFPDSLTTWKTTARVITPQTTVGNITHDIKTKKDVIVRLQAPRFFTERDQVTISANVHNYTDQAQKIKVSLKAGGLKNLGEEFVWVTVPQNGEKRVDWTCLVSQVPSGGRARLTVMAQTEKSSDAMERLYPVIPHGIEKFIAGALVLKGEDAAQETSANFTIQVPAERIKESTSLEIVLSPSLAAAMLDALPYLADYPYGCVEQTMSRFLPSVIVAKSMREMGLSPEAYISDVLEPRGDPQGHPQRRSEATVSKLDRMVLDGLNRLYDFQHKDGGWGWWKEDDTNRFMTAYVVWGLALARDAGVDVRGDVMDRAVQYLQTELVEEENNPDTLAWMLHALSWTRSTSAFETKHSDRLWQMRDQLNPYARALFAVSEWNRGDKEHAQILTRNLANGIKEDKANGTAHWGEAGINYRWSEGGVEATAFAVKALAMIDPQSVYLEPAVKWLCLNRRGASWKNTRDTAIAILGLTEYLKTTAELNPDYEYAILVNGKTVRQGKVDAGNVFTFNRILRLPDDVVQDGPNTVEVKLKGKGALYLSGYLEYFTLEEDITAAGNEIFVERKYSREATQETLLKGYATEWIPLENGQELKSGERVRVEITLDAKNHYEYLVVEDHKPAGFEAVDLKSSTTFAEAVDEEGRLSGTQSFAYREFRDKKVAFFITKLPQGRHTLTYELRAEVPGEFHGMPDEVHAMYVPEIRANSAEARFKIGERVE